MSQAVSRLEWRASPGLKFRSCRRSQAAPEVQAVQEVAADDNGVFRRHHRMRPAARDEQRLAGGHGDAHAAACGIRKEAGRLQAHLVLCIIGIAVPAVPEE